MKHLLLVTCLLLAAACAEREPDDSLATITDELAVTGPPGSWQTTLLPRGDYWLYDDDENLQGTPWKLRQSSNSWGFGRSPLGYGESYLRTTTKSRHTVYAVKQFPFDSQQTIRKLYLRVMYDDGFVFYINGKEGGRANMPSGTVTDTTLATGHEAENRYVTYDISAQIPRIVPASDSSEKANWLAFEIHQASPSSSDLVFDAELIAWVDGPLDTRGFESIARGSYWRFWDRAAAPPTTWRANAYDDGAWSAGPTPLGYGEDYIAAEVTPGPITTYFRKRFTSFDQVKQMRAQVRYDDGFVVYLNGSEIGRASMPGGPVGHSTLAVGHEATGYQTFDWSSAIPLIVHGENTLAVEVHQASASSSDLVFDLELELNTAWKHVPVEGEATIRGVAFKDSLRGWLAGTGERGAGGVLRRSTDGGVTWQAQVETEEPLTKIELEASPSPQHGWAIGEGGTILVTHDAGGTWTRTGADLTTGDFVGLSFVSATRGWVVAHEHDFSDGTDLAVVFRTDDGGATWTRMPGDVPGFEVFDLGFAHDASQHGWLVGRVPDAAGVKQDAIYRSTDGGATWTRQLTGEAGLLADVEVASSTTIWVVGFGPSTNGGVAGEKKLVSHDGGLTWQSLPATSNNAGLFAVDFVGPAGWAVGLGGSIIHTANGGATWQVQREAIPSGRSSLLGVDALDADRVWVVSSGGLFLTTTGGD